MIDRQRDAEVAALETAYAGEIALLFRTLIVNLEAGTPQALDFFAKGLAWTRRARERALELMSEGKS